MEYWCYAPAPMQARGRCVHNNYIAGEWVASKEAIENRIATARTRGRGDRTIELFRSQLRRATERQKILVEELQNQAQPVIGLEPLAACIVDITVQAAQA